MAFALAFVAGSSVNRCLKRGMERTVLQSVQRRLYATEMAISVRVNSLESRVVELEEDVSLLRPPTLAEEDPEYYHKHVAPKVSSPLGGLGGGSRKLSSLKEDKVAAEVERVKELIMADKNVQASNRERRAQVADGAGVVEPLLLHQHSASNHTPHTTASLLFLSFACTDGRLPLRRLLRSHRRDVCAPRRGNVQAVDSPLRRQRRLF